MNSSLLPFKFFEKIVCINMQHRNDRWENSQRIFKQLNIADRVERIEGFNAIQAYQENGMFASYFQPNGPSEMDIINLRRTGCAFSFIKTILYAKEKNYENILIFEDDVDINTTPDVINNVLENSINELPDDWEMFYLSANPTTAHGHITPVTDYSPNLCKIHAAFCCHAVSISHRVYDKIISSYHSYIDIFDWVLKKVNFDTFCLNEIQPSNKTYMPKKLLFNQINNFSDIENCLRPNNDVIKLTYQTYSHILSV